MSDYCGRNRYNVKERIGDDTCPFYAPYWDFLARYRDKLGDNHRVAMPYRTWDLQSGADQQATRAQSAAFLDQLDADCGAHY